MKITVYEKAGCMPCTMTRRALERAGADYEAVRLDEDEAARAHVTDTLGHHQAPVVTVEERGALTHWSGYRPERGYICKTCGDVAPTGVGYVSREPAAVQRSATTHCACGASRAPQEA